jgi:hypothetical protein
MIKQLFLDHSGGIYNYKVHSKKIENLLENFITLKDYLNKIFSYCPDRYFNSGPRSSCLKFRMGFKLHKIIGHEVNTLCEAGLRINKELFSNHSKVQNFMLERDNKTIAIEVPIWLKVSELDGFKTLFKAEEPLTGHIDVLRVEDNKIWVWDYKPNSIKEKYAATQVFYYALMLSKRSNINLNHFRCGYFDQDYAFIFKPKIHLN